jgi:Trypsin
MTLALSRSVRSLAIVAALAAAPAPARALVGAKPDGRFADRVAMVLIRGGDSAGFCSALVLSPRILLTAAHCLRPLSDMAVHYRDAAGAAVIIPVDAAIPHPLYRADAIKARVESIDLALIRAARPLDPRFTAAAIGDGGPPPIGAAAIVTGYGAAREGDWSSGGTLRSVTLAVREPASTVLIWAADPAGREAGACNGDSGAPIWSADGSTAIAIVAWAQAPHGRGCGGLTQGPLLAPLKGWIEETERKLKNAR